MSTRPSAALGLTVSGCEFWLNVAVFARNASSYQPPREQSETSRPSRNRRCEASPGIFVQLSRPTLQKQPETKTSLSGRCATL